MDKRVLQTYAVWAKENLEQQIEVSLKTLGINGDNDFQNATQSGDYTYIDGDPNSYPASLFGRRRDIISQVRLKGYQNIIEEFAYTWFNRLVALRFMELHNYLSHGFRVLSSTSGSIEPDILKNLGLVKNDLRLDMNTCDQLKGQSKTEELFRYVLICQCNALSDILPKLFPKDSEYMELLLPKSLLIGETVLTRLVRIPEENFSSDVQIIGWLYQYYNTRAKEKVFANLKKNIKISKEDIPAATQLFTPDWIVRYMVENSLGRLWLEGYPNEELKARWKYYLEEAEQEPDVAAQLEVLRAERRNLAPKNIRIIDPCCGSGHILVYAFDVLMQIYESQGYSKRDAAQNIVRNNLYGLDIDDRAVQLAYFAVMMKAREYDRQFFTRSIQPQVYYLGGDQELREFGSLVLVDDPGEMPEDELTLSNWREYDDRLNAWSYRYLLAQKYDVVVTNPPYMGASNMNGTLAEYVKKNFPDSKTDLFAVFMERCRQLTGKNGYQAMITQHAWMFLSSFEKLRTKLQTVDTVNMAHLGIGIFKDLNSKVVQSVSFILANRHIAGYIGSYNRLFENQGLYESISDKIEWLRTGKHLFTVCQDNFSKIPGAPVAYWVSENVIVCYRNKPIYEYASPCKGIDTGDNNLFLRLWYEVLEDKMFLPNGKKCVADDFKARKWFPYNKGGEYRRWYGNNEYLINWSNCGETLRSFKGSNLRNKDKYFLRGITWSTVTSGTSSFRFFDYGFLFDNGGSCLYANANLLYIQGFLNSCVANLLLGMSPTLNTQPGNIGALPLALLPDKIGLVEETVKTNINLSRSDWDSFETSWDFKRHPLVRGVGTVAEAFAAWEKECSDRFTQLKANEEELNRIFIDIYGLQDELTPEVEDKDVTVRRANRERDVKSLISYLIGVVMGRYSRDEPGLAYAGGEWDASKYRTYQPDDDGIVPIYRGIGMEDGLTAKLIGLLKLIYDEDSYRQNIDYIADSIGHNHNESSEEALNRYLNDGFFADHLKVYQKRPIYWLFSSGKNSGFKCLIYMHRYTSDTLARINSRYFLPESTRLKNDLEELAVRLSKAEGRDRVRLEKERQKVAASYNEAIEYGQILDHMANRYIEIDLDDGVKANYAKFQGVEMVTDSGSKVKKDLLAPIK